MDEAQGDGWAEIQSDGIINGQICLDGYDDADLFNNLSKPCRPDRPANRPDEEIADRLDLFLQLSGIQFCILGAALFSRNAVERECHFL
ncbi:hypothetical protein QA644_34580 (plasmid) [Rhizobium sp. CC1099]|uniref:hypothetical protein n=1 Tax=Rhizobium sp. CC1099 TaxID=3039160 RepID=UPI0024B1DB9F|nr:hypothetical protein [Rhizobium sp. CC1099]WFU92023.1 hypothetical protein QA644_34580 [Rhizobium sp. CC1099]